MENYFAFLPIISEQLKIINKQIQEFGRKYAESYPQMLDKTAEMATQGWLLVPSMQPRDIYQIDIDNIDGYFLKYYSVIEEYHKLKDEVLNCKIFIKHRPLVEECFYCYENKKYKIIIPAALTVFEGVVVEFSRSNKWGKSLVLEVKRLVNQSKDFAIELLVLKSILVFMEKIFQDRRFDDKRLAIINRHWILHGRDTIVLWTQSDALKLLNALYSFTLIS